MKTAKTILIVFVLLGVMAAGFYLRVLNPDRFAAKVYNVNAYYFYKSQYLNDHGRLPEKDIWSFAPEVFPENVPPLLAYGNVGIYKAVKIFKPDVDFYDFAMLFPVVIYALWAFFGFWLVYYLLGSRLAGFIFAALLTATPLAFDLTAYGRYTEEPLGVFFFFLALVFLVKFFRTPKALFFWPAILFIAAFYLTWQQFPIFIAGLLAAGLIHVLKDFGNRRRIIAYYSLLIALPLIFGHLASRYLMGIDYSPLAMLYESYLGVKNMGSEFVRTAMQRRDWRNLYLFEFIGLIGFAGWVLAGSGFLKCLLDFKKPDSRIVLIFGALTLAVAFGFFKSRYLALAPLLLIFAAGGEFLLRGNRGEWEKVLKFFGAAKTPLNKWRRFPPAVKTAALILLFSVVLGLGCSVFFAKKEPKSFPRPGIVFSSLPQNIESGKEYEIGIKLENGGGDSFQNPASFGGLHIAAENALVKDIVSWYDNGQSQVVVKPDAERGNIYWFEVKYGSFKADEFGYLWFRIIPQELPVNIYYRGWLPGEPTFWQRLKTFAALRPEYRDWHRHTWRSEEAIQRIPANDDASQEICPIKVYAAHEEFQNFRCFKKSLSSGL